MDVGPFSAVLVAKVRLMKNWKLKSKFRFTLKNPAIEKQKEYLRKHIGEHRAKIDMAKKIYPNIPFSLMPLDHCDYRLKDLNAPSFLDLEFEPSDLSIFDKTFDAHFDVFVHWRRPHDFLHADFE